MKVLWGAIGGLVALILVFGLGLVMANGPLKSLFGDSGDSSRSVQIVQSVQKEQQVVLLSLGIQGIDEKQTKNDSFYGWFDVPGTSKAKFILFEFKAKLGLEGSDVEIEEVGNNEFLVTIPDFVFIGHDDINFKLAAEKNGILSWAAAKDDDLEAASKILNDKNRDRYLVEYEDALRSQAEVYYRQLISSIDSSAKVQFAYGEE